MVLSDPNAMLNQKVGKQWSQSRWWRRSSQCRGWRGGKSSLLEEMFVDKMLAKIGLMSVDGQGEGRRGDNCPLF